MPRYRLDIEYDGTPFKGFQAQEEGVPTVQGAIETAIFNFCGERLRIHAAGRTDTGVHALLQVVHADLQKDWRPEVVRDALNAHLVPHPITMLSARIVSEDFHARFSARGRRYLYRILDRKPPPAIERQRVFWVKTPLDIAPMHEAARHLVGTHDFTTFRDLACQSKSPVKTLDELNILRVEGEVRFHLAARSFLHRQVRSMVGTLAEVGAGRWSALDVADALEAKDRRRCGPVAPAHGLYLSDVDYPNETTVDS